MRRALALVLVFLSACTSHHPHATQSSSPPAPIAGEIVVAYPWEPPTLNPFIVPGEAPATRELTRPLYPELFKTLPGGSMQPSLVDHVISESSTAVDEILRNDAMWSDGVSITVSDVIFTWHTIMNPRWHIASRRGYDAIASITEPAPHELRMTFAHPISSWRSLFSDGFGVLPEHALSGKDFNSALRSSWPVSGGPYVLTTYIRGLELVFDANPHWWGERPHASRVRVEFVPDQTTALQLYRAGKVDVVGPYSSGDFARRLAQEPDIHLTQDQSTLEEVIAMSTKQLPDASVRNALVEATNRDALVAGLVRAEGSRIPDGVPYSSANASSGLATLQHQSISIAIDSGDDIQGRIATAMYYELHALGVDLNIVAVEYEEEWGYWLGSNRFQIALVRQLQPEGPLANAQEWPLYKVTATVGARSSVTGVQSNASSDGFLEGAAHWTRTT
ncbi:MAG: ABC transporter substrate-binding protein [Actinomycetota bacterium]